MLLLLLNERHYVTCQHEVLNLLYQLLLFCIYVLYIHFYFCLSCPIWRSLIKGSRLKEMAVAMLYVFSGKSKIILQVPLHTVFQFFATLCEKLYSLMYRLLIINFTLTVYLFLLPGFHLLKVSVRRRERLWTALFWTAPSDYRDAIIAPGWLNWSLPAVHSTAPQVKSKVWLTV